jgi:hypothetical protein
MLDTHRRHAAAAIEWLLLGPIFLELRTGGQVRVFEAAASIELVPEAARRRRAS